MCLGLNLTMHSRHHACIPMDGKLEPGVALVLAAHGGRAVAVVVRAIEVQPGVVALRVLSQALLHVVVKVSTRRRVAQPLERRQLQEPAGPAHELDGRQPVLWVREPREEDASARVV